MDSGSYSHRENGSHYWKKNCHLYLFHAEISTAGAITGKRCVTEFSNNVLFIFYQQQFTNVLLIEIRKGSLTSKERSLKVN